MRWSLCGVMIVFGVCMLLLWCWIRVCEMLSVCFVMVFFLSVLSCCLLLCLCVVKGWVFLLFLVLCLLCMVMVCLVILILCSWICEILMCCVMCVWWRRFRSARGTAATRRRVRCVLVSLCVVIV